MVDMTQVRNPLEWEGHPWNRLPVWPRDPDIAIIKILAMQHLAHELPSPLDDTMFEVTFFGGGAFNRLYVISYAGHATTYMFRVALPVIPFFKTESEVATLTYLRAKTSIPVPRVYAWHSSAKNDLGFEWIIMERVGGVTLIDVWRKISWERKLRLVDELAEFVRELRNQKFDAIGSLYFKSALAIPRDGKGDILHEEAVNAIVADEGREDKSKDINIQLNPTTASLAANESQHTDTSTTTKPEADQNRSDSPRGSETDSEVNSNDIASKKSNQTEACSLNQAEQDFEIGPLFSSLFFLGCRLYLPGHRGPYRSCSEWLQAQIQIQQTLAKTGQPEWDPDYDSDFEEDAPNMINICQEYTEVIPVIFPEHKDKVVAIPQHHDMNSANILVDPETYDIMGIVDWELINIQPIWKSTDYPDFMKMVEPQNPEEPPIPDYDIEDDYFCPIEARDRWDYQLLRNRFDETMERLSGDSSYLEILKSAESKRKRKFVEMISDITDDLQWAEKWIKKYRAVRMESEAEEESVEEAENESDDEAKTDDDVEDKTPSAETSQVNGFIDEASQSDKSLHKSDIMTDRNEHDLRTGPEVTATVRTESSAVESDQGVHFASRLDDQEEGSSSTILQRAAMAISDSLKKWASMVAGGTKTE